MTPWPEFRTLDPATIARAMRGRLLLDPYRLFTGSSFAGLGLDYFTLGAPPLRAARHRDA
jgi:UDPglucose 6-dehydrogenase